MSVNDDEFWTEFSNFVVQMLCKYNKNKIAVS